MLRENVFLTFQASTFIKRASSHKLSTSLTMPHPGPGIEPGSFGYAPTARTVKLSETSSVTTFQSNNFLFNTITEKYLLKYSRCNYLSIFT
ncbi:Protein of unknown function [Cotesia congregata]|uniref:Uncharacterized protein n=1 Tax=Cotesia congregata TaxID=51543 RepID=A0A8J2H5J2_COTCN|nr:Protein of unknown function [Cotesia congregata]